MQFLSGLIEKKNRVMFFLRLLVAADSWKELKTADVLFFGHDNDCSYMVDGKQYSPLLDSLMFFLKKRGVSLEAVSKPYCGSSSSSSSSHTYADRKTVNKLFLLAAPLKKIITFITRQNYVDVARDLDSKIWTKIIKQVMPNIIIGIQPGDGLCMACHHLQIPIFDLQHGVIDDMCPAYGKSFNLKREPNCLPTGYLCWNDESSIVLKRWCANRNIKVIVLGNPWLYRFEKKSELDYVIHSALSEPPFEQAKKCILISLQWALDLCYPEFFDPDEFLHPAILDAVKKLGDDLNWLIRLHPIQMKNANLLHKLEQIFGNHKNVYVQWASSKPLPVVLSFAHAHVTWDSATVLEASLFGIKTYLLNPGRFSIQQLSSQHQQSREAFSELPFLKQESDGLLQRADGFSSTQSLIDWINEISADDQPNRVPISFNENKLYELVTRQDQKN